MADKTYMLSFEMSDGSEKTVQFTAPQGAQGPQGEPGEDAPQESVLYVAQDLTDAQKAQARENIGAARGAVVLWENGSPTSNFAAQTVSLDLSGYSYVEITCRPTTSGAYHTTSKFKVGDVGTCVAISPTLLISGYAGLLTDRAVTVSTSGVVFSNGGYGYSGDYGFAQDDKYCIPVRIVGYKD